ncbi:hypothetical protein [Frateuria defendens]|uniref:hypothetical protein n=1 Tax=Frateuria defendens TaxID=2219559 RepID=UPI001292EE04|nr:hypothetical protein [Frateuria defendens]
MNVEKIKEYAILLEESISENVENSKDVEFLSKYEPLQLAISDAKLGRITSPRDLGGLSRWLFDSDIMSFPVLSNRLSGFQLLLRGWEVGDASVKDKNS